MSTIVISNIKATGETASRAVSGVAAAWINFNGTGTVAARDSVNVASLTDNGTANYTVNFSSSFSSANYSFQNGSVTDGTGRGTVLTDDSNSFSILSSSFTLPYGLTSNANSAGIVFDDVSHVMNSFHGDLA
jgi:hypothetical protein